MHEILCMCVIPVLSKDSTHIGFECRGEEECRKAAQVSEPGRCFLRLFGGALAPVCVLLARFGKKKKERNK